MLAADLQQTRLVFAVGGLQGIEFPALQQRTQRITLRPEFAHLWGIVRVDGLRFRQLLLHLEEILQKTATRGLPLLAIGGLLAIGRRFRGALTMRDTIAPGGCAVAGQPDRGGGSAALHRLDQALQLGLLLLQLLAAEAQ